MPRIEAPLPIMSAIPITCAGEMDLDGIKMQVKDLLFMMDLQEYTRNDPPTHTILLSSMNILLLNELLAQNTPNESLIDAYLNVLLDHLLPKDAPLLSVIFDQFYTLAQLVPLYHSKLGPEREVLVVQRLVTGIRSAFSDVDAPPSEQDELIAKLIIVLLEWLMVLPHDWLMRHHSLREQVFAVLEESLRKGTVTKMGRSHSVMLTSKNVTASGSSSPGKSLDRLPPVIPADPTTEPDNDDEVCLGREAAEFALVHLMHHLKNFSPEYGPTMMNSHINEPGWHHPGDDRILYFSIGDTCILALQQLGDGGLSGRAQVRITIRNAAGRFTWDAHTFMETFSHRTTQSLFPPTEPHRWQDLGRLREFEWMSSASVVDRPTPYNPHSSLMSEPMKRSLKMMPIYEDGKVDLEKTDMLNELLAYITEEHPECIEKGQRTSLNIPSPIPEVRQKGVNRVAEYCKEQVEAEGRVARRYGNAIGHQAILPAQPDGPSPMIPSFQFCRQFLASFGFLTPTESADMPLSINVLTKTTGLARDLKGLDMKQAREAIKIALLYVSPGQEDELAILRNTPDVCSPAYNEFLRALGWRVDLATHHGYAGGLELGMTLDNQALYYCTSTTELIYHEATRLTLSEDQTEARLMVAKKRHIGNDHVHIIWNEHYRDYRPSPRGDYGNVNIVISPGPAHLYRVSIFRESSIVPFGPLVDGALLPRALLGPLVRCTAICAHRAVLSSLGRLSRLPLSQRGRDLALIVTRHAQQKWSLEQFLNYALFATQQLPEEMPKDHRPTPPLEGQLENLQIEQEAQ